MLLLAIGPEASAGVLQCMTDGEIEEIGARIADPPSLDETTRVGLVKTFATNLKFHHEGAKGGLAYAQDLLERAFGGSRAREMIGRLSTQARARPFEAARRAPAQQLVTFLEAEQPQTVALVLSYLEADQAAAVLKALPVELQPDVTCRMAQMDPTGPNVIGEVEDVLEARLSSLMQDMSYSSPGGVDVLVNILNRVDRTVERGIMTNLEVQDPDLAEEIRRRMFLFEDLTRLDDRSIQRVLRDVDGHDLALALKSAPEAVGQRLLANMSARAAEAVREDLAYLGPVRLKEVEEAQGRVLAIVHRLEEANEIILSRSPEDDIVV